MLCHAWANHPQVSRLDIIINPRSPRELFVLPDRQAHVHLYNLDARPFSIREWWQIRHLTHQLMPDWIYAPYFVMPPHKAPSKRMLTVHDAIPLELQSMSLIQRVLLTHLVRFNMARADCVTTVSLHAAQQIRQHYRYCEALAVIPNGVEDAFFDIPSSNQFAHYGITQPFGLCVSSNQPHKNLNGLIHAWAHAYRSGDIPSHSQLVIAGHTDARRHLPWCDPEYADIPIIHISDPEDGLLNQLYHAAHICIQPSLAEGFGLPILEALAAERVVLCHDYPTMRELHGEVVAYTDMRHTHHIADAITRLWHNQALREHYIRQAKAHALLFRWNAIADRYIAHMYTH
jgi:glycosyltransferase involved in cell wall biosynthesis